MANVTQDKFSITSKLDEACRVRELIGTAVQNRQYSKRDCFSVQLALEEALANAIWHGNGGDPSKQVQIFYQLSDEFLEVSICDEGPGFDPQKTPNPTDTANIEKSHGRGVLLIHSYMDEVRYNEHGNCITMIKRKNSPLPIPDPEA